MASSAKQIAANRAHGSKSKGPVSAGGKLKSSQNATLHGLLSTRLVVGGENPLEYQLLLNSLTEDLRPEGANEQMLVEKIAVALWKMKRLNAAEAASIQKTQSLVTAKHLATPDVEKTSLPLALALKTIPENSANFIRYQTQLEGQYYRAMTMLNLVQDRRKNSTAWEITPPSI